MKERTKTIFLFCTLLFFMVAVIAVFIAGIVLIVIPPENAVARCNSLKVEEGTHCVPNSVSIRNGVYRPCKTTCVCTLPSGLRICEGYSGVPLYALTGIGIAFVLTGSIIIISFVIYVIIIRKYLSFVFDNDNGGF